MLGLWKRNWTRKRTVETPIARNIVYELVSLYQNHPSVILWANGNENGFNLEVDDLYHLYDLQDRPIFKDQSHMFFLLPFPRRLECCAIRSGFFGLGAKFFSPVVVVAKAVLLPVGRDRNFRPLATPPTFGTLEVPFHASDGPLPDR